MDAKVVRVGRLEERFQKRRGFVRHSDDLVRRLTVQLEVEFCLGPPVLPVVVRLEFGAPQREGYSHLVEC